MTGAHGTGPDSPAGGGAPSVPRPELGTILVTGASGYIGGRLVPELLARGYRVRAMVRAAHAAQVEHWPGAEVVVGDAGDRESLEAALRGVYAAYYLIHSLLLGPRGLEAVEASHARLFREAAESQGTLRIVYLGGLGDVRKGLSRHLRSRARVAEELERGTVPVTVLRAAIIIGSGSASYEILHHLVRRLPVLPVPRWGRTRCQPISVHDVIHYLVGALELPETAGHSYDIGGPDVLTYREMLETVAQVLGKRRLFIPSPFPGIQPYAYLTGLLTPVPSPITWSLMEGLRNDVVCQDDRIRALIPLRLNSYREAIVEAMGREERDQVHTRWTDAYPPAHELATRLDDLEHPPHFIAMASLLTTRSADALFGAVCRIGGREGWFHGNWLWRSRGAIDRMLLGVGTGRGRRSRANLRRNDVVDFWRVEQIRVGELLLLRAEMRLPGKGWLEFRIDRHFHWRRLSVTAYFEPRGLLGRAYWYAMVPFHHYLFANLIRQIERRS